MIPIEIIGFVAIQGLTVAGIMGIMFVVGRWFLNTANIICNYNDPETYWGKMIEINPENTTGVKAKIEG